MNVYCAARLQSVLQVRSVCVFKEAKAIIVCFVSVFKWSFISACPICCLHKIKHFYIFIPTSGMTVISLKLSPIKQLELPGRIDSFKVGLQLRLHAQTIISVRWNT